MLKQYINRIYQIEKKGDAREESYYSTLEELLNRYGKSIDISIHITTMPQKTEAGNPDFRIWNGNNKVIGYIEAKKPGTNLDLAEESEQLQRYRRTFPNLILTNFYEFRIYKNGILTNQVSIARYFITHKLKTIPPLENRSKLIELFNHFFSFSMPKIETASSLAVELAKRTRFMEKIIESTLIEDIQANSELFGFYEAFKNI